jgi:hypothetical protein
MEAAGVHFRRGKENQITGLLRNSRIDPLVSEFHASWHPCGDMTGISEKLSHVEIIPRVKANVHSQED